jgi:rubrerythrin
LTPQSDISLGQALRNAIHSENAVSKFYQLFSDSTEDGRAKHFLREMAFQEKTHAQALQSVADRLRSGKLPETPDLNMSAVETAPASAYEDDLGFPQALEVAMECEQHAHMYYSAIAEQSVGETKTFSDQHARWEEAHVRLLAERQDQL